MTIETLDKLYSMNFKHNYADGEFELFKEELENGEISYWVNALENTKQNTSVVAVKFNKEQLDKLAQIIIDELY